jgi:hypothetical protein
MRVRLESIIAHKSLTATDQVSKETELALAAGSTDFADCYFAVADVRSTEQPAVDRSMAPENIR